MPKSPEELAHIEWLGYVQPVGLVVSVPAMLEAQCYVNKNIMGEHARFLSCLPRDGANEVIPELRDLSEFVQKVLGWDAEDLVKLPARGALPAEHSRLEVVLPQYHETLRPNYVVPVFNTNNQSPATNNYILLIQELATGTDFDEPDEADSAKHWNAAPQAKFERLLRESGVPIGLLTNGRQLRLVYSPRGETSGHATFNVDEMVQVAGRPMFAALQMLLCNDRMFSLDDNQRLPAILENSRKYQNTVSTALAEQVLAALYELMRGFQAADDVRRGELLRDVLANDPNHVYSGLLTVLMRLVFVMYAEDRDLLSSDSVYSNHYSVTGLFKRLREDAGRFPDTMNQRFGAWSQLITLFRLVYEGGQHGDFKLPGRKGYLFDPDRYPFLEGRQRGDRDRETATVPRVSDGIVFNVLQNLLILDGERLSYRTLDVEQIGSVYETVMGFNLEVAQGKSIAIKPIKSHGAPATINLEALLKTAGKDRANWLKEQADQKLGTADAALLKDAGTIEELLAALDKKIAKKITERVVPAGAIVLQPSDERRRSGSHYTPRSLTEPIVRTTLEPILKQLVSPFSPAPGEKVADRPDGAASAEPQVWQPTAADKRRFTAGEIAERIRLSELKIEYARLAREKGVPHPSQILDLKICDPAMGSGAFLVETCRQLADHLVTSWYAHATNNQPLTSNNYPPTDIPPDEDELLYARRLIAQRCLYGVDKNIMAVDLAKLALWLVTLAKDHPFTFLDHSMRYGDSLVGLTRKQIIGFHWEPNKQKKFGEELIQKRLDRATEARAKILNAREDVPYRDQESRLAVADEALNVVRLTGDACVSAFFAGSKKKEREDRCDELFASVSDWYASGHDISKRGAIAAAAASLRSGEHPLPPFHWEIEFPEVFSRENGGFDGFVGNPPFAGKNTLIAGSRRGYVDWLKAIHEEAHGNSDLVAHFFRRAFDRIRLGGSLGLIATNTIRQGDTRSTGLRWICKHKGVIYNATRRLRWPGQAAVVVCVVHISRGKVITPCVLDRNPVDKITAYLFHRGTSDDPFALTTHSGCCSNGVKIYGPGFTFDDSDSSGLASPVSRIEQLNRADPRNAERVFPYLGGEEMNESPTQCHSRFVIDFEELTEEEARKWPDLMQIVVDNVKPQRDRVSDKRCRELWWQFERPRTEFRVEARAMSRILALLRHGDMFAFSFVPSTTVCADSLVLFSFETSAAFCFMQSRVHEFWARFFSGSIKDDLRYTSTDCFETFPFIDGFDQVQSFQIAGEDYLTHRANVMRTANEGLTQTYNRFHDPHEKSSEMVQLRELHAAMDRAVLEAYGWDDLAKTATCEFLLDYEEEDEEVGSSQSSDGSKRGKKKPWRLRWPDDFRDEVLARLLELNEQRHKEELLTGKASTSKRSSTDDNSDTDDDQNGDEDEDTTKTKKASRKTKSPKKSKKAPAPGQQEMEF